MIHPPTGTVTFLFTDIEGSAKLAREYPASWEAMRARHHAVLRNAIAAHDGYVFQIIGDAFCAAFHTANDALNAALDAQRAFQTDDAAEKTTAALTSPPTPVTVRVRMGLHTGDADACDGEYQGYLTLTHVQRIMSVAHGGQALLSQATYELVRDQLPTGVILRDMGEHRLKDLVRPEPIYQVVAPDLLQDFPPLKTLDYHPNNLPTQATRFIGRESDIAAIKQTVLRPDVRLLTLTGVGGTGKTRLALQVAAELLDEFRDGVFFISLAPISDPALIVPTIAQVLNVREAPARPLLESLKDYLREKQLLLLLDNFEQVIVAAPTINDLLNSAGRLKVLVTSRELLRLYGEQDYAVSPLSKPDPKQLPVLEQLTQYEAVQLFIERAKAVKPDFTVTNHNAPAVAEICHQLDGLPLAIELAAARVRLLPPQKMLVQLGNRLRFLSSGTRDAVARQQTLRGMIDWSYQLLSADEKHLFAQLSVFVGGCTLEAAEAVCDTSASLSVLDGLQSLSDKSLLRQADVNGEPRFSLLETIREFAHERLAQSSEWRDIQERHFNFYVTLAEQLKPALRGRLQREYLERLESDHDNLRAALDWAWQRPYHQPLLRLGAALDLFWRQHDDWSEARKWFGLMLTLDTQPEYDDLRRQILASSAYAAFFSAEFETARQQARTCLELSHAVGDQQRQAQACLVLGAASMSQSAFAEAHTLLQQAQTLFRAAGDQLGVGDALHWLGHTAQEQGDYAQARAYFQDSYTRMHTLGDLTTQTLLLGDLGTVFYLQEDHATARGYCEQGLALCRALGSKFAMAIALNLLGDIARCEEDHTRADTLYHDSLSLYQKFGLKSQVASVQQNLAYVRLYLGEARKAAEMFVQSLDEFRTRGEKIGVMDCLAGLAGVAAQSGQAERSARLLGASERLRLDIGTKWWPANHIAFKRHQATAREQLGETAFTTAWEVGYAMTIEQAIAYALET